MKSRIRHLPKALLCALLALELLLGLASKSVSAQAAGEYDLSASLSCYVNAMGGVEFGAPLLLKTQLVVDASGSESLRLTFGKNSVTIYSVTCDTFVDASPSYVTDDRGVTSGTIGIYDQSGVLVTSGVSYTLSDDTALNASNEAVRYVDSITLPIDSRRSTYNLTLYINSNVMGVQFCNANDRATAATYPATLSVSWDSLSTGAAAASSAQTQAQAAALASSAVSEEETDEDVSKEEMNGLSVYKVGDEAEDETASAQSVVVQKVRLNTLALVIILIVAAVIFAAGAVLFFTAKRSLEKEGQDEN